MVEAAMYEGAPRNSCTDIASINKPSKPPIHRWSVGRSAVHCGQEGEAYSKYGDEVPPAAAGCSWGCYSTPLGPTRATCTGEPGGDRSGRQGLRHREPINGCRKAAVKAEKAVRCTIQ